MKQLITSYSKLAQNEKKKKKKKKKKSEMIDKYLELARKLNKLMEHNNDDDINFCWKP